MPPADDEQVNQITTLPSLGATLGTTGFGEGWVPSNSLDEPLRARIASTLRERGPEAFRDQRTFDWRPMGFAVQGILVRLIRQSELYGFGLYGVWTPDNWSILTGKREEVLTALRSMHIRLSRPEQAIELVAFVLGFQITPFGAWRVIFSQKDLNLTRPPREGSDHEDEGSGFRSYDSLSIDRFNALLEVPSAQFLPLLDCWEINAVAQCGDSLYAFRCKVSSDGSGWEHESRILAVNLPVSLALDDRTWISANEASAAIFANFVARSFSECSSSIGSQSGRARRFASAAAIFRICGQLLLAVLLILLATIVAGLAAVLGLFFLLPGLVVAATAESYANRILTRGFHRVAFAVRTWGETMHGSVALLLSWYGLIGALTYFVSGFGGLLGVLALLTGFGLATYEFIRNETLRYRIARNLESDYAVLADLREVTIQYATSALLFFMVLPLAILRINETFGIFLPEIQPDVDSCYAFVAKSSLMGLSDLAQLLGLQLPSNPATSFSVRCLELVVGWGIKGVIVALVAGKLWARRIQTKEALAKLDRSVADAVAMGTRAIGPLRRELRKPVQPARQKSIAIALGLLADTKSRSRLTELARTATDPEAYLSAALGAMLLGADEFRDITKRLEVSPQFLGTEERLDLWKAAIAIASREPRSEAVEELRKFLAIPNASLDLKFLAAKSLLATPGVYAEEDIYAAARLFLTSRGGERLPGTLELLTDALAGLQDWGTFDNLADALRGKGSIDPARGRRLLGTFAVRLVRGLEARGCLDVLFNLRRLWYQFTTPRPEEPKILSWRGRYDYFKALTYLGGVYAQAILQAQTGRADLRSVPSWGRQNLADLLSPHNDYEEGPANTAAITDAPKPQPLDAKHEKIGRNAPCPCGSGKRYKQCHGRL